jgi:hypothetical protein
MTDEERDIAAEDREDILRDEMRAEEAEYRQQERISIAKPTPA